MDYPALNEQKAADEAMHNLEYPAFYEQKAADEAIISAVNLPVNLDYPVPIKQKNNALGSAFDTGGDRLRMVSTITPMGSVWIGLRSWKCRCDIPAAAQPGLPCSWRAG